MRNRSFFIEGNYYRDLKLFLIRTTQEHEFYFILNFLNKSSSLNCKNTSILETISVLKLFSSIDKTFYVLLTSDEHLNGKTLSSSFICLNHVLCS